MKNKDVEIVKRAAEKAFGGWKKHLSGEIKAKLSRHGNYTPHWRGRGFSAFQGGLNLTESEALEYAKKQLDKHGSLVSLCSDDEYNFYPNEKDIRS